ncbi:MAG: response regulator [Cyanobacteria bacterium P01_A01_bin.137]
MSKILLAGTNRSDNRSMVQQLEQTGYDVVFATEGGDEAILLAVTESPDLILIETNLPVINGWQVIKILKASTVTQKIPVVALVHATTEAEQTQALESGCDFCALDPFDIPGLLDTIKTLLDPISRASIKSSVFQGAEHRPLQHQNSETLGKVPAPSIQNADTLPNSAAEAPTIVYVDDSPVDSQVMAGIVRGAGYSFSDITESLDAIPLLLEHKPQLIFLDLVMPFTNGYELCAQIRRTAAFKRTPIIIVTNNNGIIDRVRAKIVGASGFFSKPVKQQRVLTVLAKYLDHSDKQSRRIYSKRLFG